VSQNKEKVLPTPDGTPPSHFEKTVQQATPAGTRVSILEVAKSVATPVGTPMSFYSIADRLLSPDTNQPSTVQITNSPAQVQASAAFRFQRVLDAPRRPMRILYVSSCTLIGGAETVLKRLLRGIDKGLYEVDVLITHERGPLHDEYAANCRKLTYVPDTVNLPQWILEQVRGGGYDYVHFFNLWILHDSIPELIKKTGCRVICSLFINFSNPALRDNIDWQERIRRIQALKASLWALTTDNYVNRKTLPQIQVIRNGVPVEAFSPGAKDPRLVAWVGRLQAGKKPLAFAEMARRLPGYRFIMIGSEDTALAQEIRGNQPSNLELRIGLGEKEISDTLSKAAYLVFTSESEGMPLSLVEAMSSGCCVVAENVGDVASAVSDGMNGYLIPLGADPVDWVVENLPKLNPVVGEEARRTVLRDFSEDNMVKQYEHLYGAVGSHYSQTRIAFVWGVLPHHGHYWETKTDSHQNAIAELSKRNVVGVFVPSSSEAAPNILHEQSYTYYHDSEPLDLLQKLKRFRPDMIFLNMFWDARWPMVLREFPEAWKALVHYGETYLKVPWADQINLFIAQQDFIAKRIAEVNGLPPERVTTIPFCLEQWLFKLLPREKTYEGIMVADFRREVKRQHLLIEAWRDVPGKLLLIGPYERSMPKGYHEDCKALARKLGIEDRVIFMDGYPHAELPELISKAKIGFLTSSHEGGSRSLLEQLASGLPCVVTSDCEGSVNMIRDGVEGYVSKPTPKDIAEKANKLLAANWTVMGMVASERVRREYPYHRMSLDYKRVVEEASPEVSIITTSMNRGKFLEDCIKSVQSQRGAKVNHIIIDGGSTDGTPQMLEKYRNHIHAYVGRDTGQTDAIIRGLQVAETQFPQTQYIGWINVDDFYTSIWLEESLKALKGAPPDVAMVCSDATQVEENGVFKQSLNYSSDLYISAEQLCKRGNIIIQPTVLIRLDALRKLRAATGLSFNPEYHYCQDLELWIRFLRNGFKIAKLNKVSTSLRYHLGQMSLTHAKEQIVERDKLLRGLSKELGIPNPVWVRG
jgi:glycosyltransferase involved in cell wall biosynthesis/GT2 family glycosyltransferase